MTEAMKITLSNQPADARWGEKATYSINNDGVTLHLTGNDDLGLIQRAARKIDGLGIKHVSWKAKAGTQTAAGHSGLATKGRKAPAKLSGRTLTLPVKKSWKAACKLSTGCATPSTPRRKS